MKGCVEYIFVGLLVINVSCTPIIKAIYRVDREVEFESIEEYRNSLEKKYRINPDRLYYTTKSDYHKFADALIYSKANYLYGVFVSDTIKILPSKFFLENQSCQGRVIKEIERQTDTLVLDSLFKHVFFQNISTGDQLKIDNNGKKKVVLIFGHTQGLLRRKDFVEVQKLMDSRQDCELYILSVDPVYYYQQLSTSLGKK